MKKSCPCEGEFYVGYLPVPPGHRAYLRRLVPAVLWLLAGVVFVWARSQNDPGDAVWDDSAARVLRGVLVSTPYPMLLCDDVGGGTPGTVLLVEVGKHGLARALPDHPVRVAISGWTLRRDGRTMLELEPGDSAFPEGPPQGAPPVLGATVPGPEVTVERLTLRGEIVDSKCSWGAMKPGEGKTHKECATLCVRSGIPPVLVSTDPMGVRHARLLVGPGMTRLDPAITELIGEPVEVTGIRARLGDLDVLIVTPQDVHGA